MYGYSAYLTDVRVTEKKHIFYISISKRIHEFVEKFKIYKFYSMMYVSLRNACEIHISDFMAAFDSREHGEFFCLRHHGQLVVLLVWHRRQDSCHCVSPPPLSLLKEGISPSFQETTGKETQ